MLLKEKRANFQEIEHENTPTVGRGDRIKINVPEYVDVKSAVIHWDDGKQTSIENVDLPTALGKLILSLNRSHHNLNFLRDWGTCSRPGQGLQLSLNQDGLDIGFKVNLVSDSIDDLNCHIRVSVAEGTSNFHRIYYIENFSSL